MYGAKIVKLFNRPGQLLPSNKSYANTSHCIPLITFSGVWKGTVLTGWRLMRCNPWGGRGYDPPAWPPKGLESMYGQSDSFDVAPKVSQSIQGCLSECHLCDRTAESQMGGSDLTCTQNKCSEHCWDVDWSVHIHTPTFIQCIA